MPVKAFSSTSANGHDTTADGYPGSVTVTLHGTNDVPVVAGTKHLIDGYKQSFTSSLSDTSAEHNTFSEVKDTGSALRLTDDETATWRDGKSTGLTVRGTLNDANIERDVDNTAQNADHRYTELSFFGVKSDGVTVTQNLEGKYGTLMLLPNGEYQYVLNPSDKDYSDLGKSGNGTETFTIYVHDKDNAVATKPIELVINVKGGYGCDGSLFHMDIDDSAGTVKEDTTYFAKGNVKGDWNIVDQDISLHFTKYNNSNIAYEEQSNIVTTEYGTISLLPDGRYTYVLNNDAQCVQELHFGQTVTETFTVHRNGLLGGQNAEITIKIKGTDDAPVLLADTSSLALHQDDAHVWDSTTAAGTFAIVDLDKGDATQLQITDVSANKQGEWKVQGKYGDYVITKSVNGTQATFSYKYELHNDGKDYNGQYDDTVTLHIQGRDGGIIEKTLPVALTADNNAPTLAASTSSVIEDAFGSGDLAHVVQAKGNLTTATDTDIHLGSGTEDTRTYSLDSGASMAKGKYGTLFLESNGSYRYVLDNNNPTVQALSGNDKDEKNSTLTEVFNVKAFDGHDYSAPSTLSITVKGTNDAPTLTLHHAGGAAGSGAALYVSETEGHMTGTMPSISGNAVAHDVDNGDTHSFKIGDTAVYAHQLKIGEWEQTHNTGDTHIGDFSIDSDGNYTFTLAHTAEALAHGDKVVLTTTVTTTDGAGATASAPVQVTVTGANTAPEITQFTQSILLDEHPESGSYAAPVLAGQAIASDVDGNAEIKSYYIQAPSGSLVKELSNDYGTLKIDPATGKYTFALNETGEKLLQSLGEGEALSNAEKSPFDFNIIVKDQYNASSEPQTLHIDLHGINDAPVFSSSVYTATVKESGVQNNGNTPMAGTLSASGQVVSTDHDARDTSTYSIDGGGELATAVKVDGETYDYCKITDYGKLYLNSSTGKYTFVLDDSPNGTVDKMAAGATHTESFGITVKDNHEATAKTAINVTINGTNDAPVLTAPTALTVTEDTSKKAFGTLTSADVDTSDSHSYSIVNAAVGQSYVTNDDGSYTNGAAAIYTPPVGASSMIGTYGTLSIAANGTYRYTLNNSSTAVQGLGLNADGSPKTLQDTFYLMVKDGNKAFDIKPVSITINGTNDLPEVAALAAVTLDAAGLVPHADVTTSLTAAQDIDGDKLTYKVGEHGSPFTNDGTGTIADIQGEFGTLSFTPHSGTDGHDQFTYKLDTSEEGLIKLAAAHAEGSSLQDTFGYSVTDGHSASQNSGPLTVNLAHTSPIYSDSDGHSTGTIGDPAASTGHLLFGGDQNDTINGGTGNDIISGGMGDDYLFGGAGNDHLYGGAGNDHLYGGAGNDHLYGGAGNDFLDGGTGTNMLDGGAGNDVLVFHQGDTINGGDGTDVLLVGGTDTTTVDDLFNSKTSNIEVIIKGDGAESLTDMQKLADKGITFTAGNQVELDGSKGWVHQDSAPGDTHSVWTNASENLSVTTANNEEADNAAKTILLHNS